MARDLSRRTTTIGLALTGAAVRASARPQAQPSDAVLTNEAIRKVLVQRLEVEKSGVGIVVGVIDAGGRRVVAHGWRAAGAHEPVTADTVFEIGSMTKAFTGLLLADMLQHGEVALDDPVARYLPADVRVPERGGRAITLLDLVTHTSGLPSLPDTFSPARATNPYADFTVAQMYEFLGRYQLTRDIGAQYAYSNLGMGLLGHALARRLGVDYETAVRRRITGPLGMSTTAIAVTPSLRVRLAGGHDIMLRPTPAWDLGAIPGAGALRSTVRDLLAFLAAELGFAPSGLKPAMDLQISAARRPMETYGTQIALAWFIRPTPRGQVIWHGGGTGGFRAFMGFDPVARRGVVVLTNAATARGFDIGLHLLGGEPLEPAPAMPTRRTAITVDPRTLEGLVGRYRVLPNVVVNITLEDGRLYCLATGEVPVEIYVEAPDKVFWRNADAQATFERGPDGRAVRFILHRKAGDLIVPRIGA